MPTSAIDSLVFRDIFGDAEMRRIWSDENRTQRYLDFEAALARAQASIGMISKEAAAEITRVCKVENIDFRSWRRRRSTSATQCWVLCTRLPDCAKAMLATTATGAPRHRTSRTLPPSSKCASRSK